jgi:hypothetical protein
MAARGSIDLSFRADLSNLTQQLAKMPDVTKKEASAMIKELEKQFKLAEKAADKLAKKTAKSFKGANGAAAGAGKAVGSFDGKLKGLSETTGEADSAIKGFGSAVGLVSPKAEKAFFVVGELAGSIEGLSRLMIAGMGPLAAITAAAALLGGVYLKASKDLKAAEEQMKASSEAAAKMAELFGALNATIENAKFDLLAAEGKKSADEIARHTAEMKANAAVSSDLKEANKEHADALKALDAGTKKYSDSVEGMTAQQAHANYEAGEWNKEHGPALQASVTLAANKVAGLKNKEAELADILIKTATQTRKNTAAKKASTKVTKDTTDAIADLIKKTEGLIPDGRSKAEVLADHLKTLTGAAGESDAAAARLAPSIKSLGQAIHDVQADELIAELDQIPSAAQNFDELVARGLALGQVQTPIQKAEELLSELNAEAERSPMSWGQVGPAIAATQQELDRLNTQAAQQQLQMLANQLSSIGGNITQAMSNIAAINMQSVMKGGTKTLELFDERAQGLNDQIAEIDEQISESTDESTTKQLEAEKELLEGRLALSEENKEVQREIENKAIREAFAMQQGASIAQIAMSTGVAIMQAWAQLGPYGAPFATAAITALAATQVAMVAAQEPPTLHLGGMVRPDENMIKARAGEGILTRQGVQAVGGEAGLAAANQGMASGGSIIVQQVYKHKVLDTVLTDSIKRGGPITTELNRRNRRGRRNPHSRAS